MRKAIDAGRDEGVDVVSLFAVIVFASAWYLLHRTPAEETLVRMFLGMLMVLAAGAGMLGLLLRLLTR